MGAAPSTPSFGGCPVSGQVLYTASNSRVYSQLPCGTDYPFNDLRPTKSVANLAQCAEHCATVANCQQAVYITTNSVCWPKSVARTTGGNTAVSAALVANLYATPTTTTTSATSTSRATSTSTSIPTSTTTRISTTLTTVTTSRATTTSTSTASLPPVTAVAPPSTSGAPSFSGYSPVFIDDFTGSYGSLPSSSSWIYDIGTQYSNPAGPAQWGTGEIQYYTSSTNNLLQSGGGSLMIVPQNNNGNWTSARIETQRKDFMAPAGKKMKIQAQIRLPDVTSANGMGIWAAFWTLGGAYRGDYWNWPAIGEFDILENVNGNGNVYGGLHCGVNPGGVCNEPNGLSSGPQTCNGGCQGQWHTYAIDVDRSTSPESLKWSVDGVTTRTVTERDINNSTIWNQVVRQGHFVLLNVAVGGAFPNGVSGTYTPTGSTVAGKEMRVDYVGVWYSD